MEKLTHEQHFPKTHSTKTFQPDQPKDGIFEEPPKVPPKKTVWVPKPDHLKNSLDSLLGTSKTKPKAKPKSTKPKAKKPKTENAPKQDSTAQKTAKALSASEHTGPDKSQANDGRLRCHQCARLFDPYGKNFPLPSRMHLLLSALQA